MTAGADSLPQPLVCLGWFDHAVHLPGQEAGVKQERNTEAQGAEQGHQREYAAEVQGGQTGGVNCLHQSFGPIDRSSAHLSLPNPHTICILPSNPHMHL